MTDAPAPQPLLHFAPERNWINDPNGLVFQDGRYHLYYQCNPEAIVHDKLSWGHATSTDLVQWEHHPVAIRYDEDGEIYSGSAVIDRGNTSGFGTADAPALVALYTRAVREPGAQTQCLAYSTDDGFTWSKYEGNPVLDRGTSDFRDPKVFRYEGPAGDYWVMVTVEAVDRQVLLFRSDDLVNWSFLSAFGPERAVDGVWECPDLFPLAVDGDESDVRWVLVISLNPGGIAGGSGTQFVIGQFDGVTFTPDADATGEAIDWVDFGRDCYAGVSFDGLARDDRTIIAWMSNWDYAHALPYTTGPFQHGMMTLPRRLSLVRVDGRIRLRQVPVVPVLVDAQIIEDLTAGAEAVTVGEVPVAGRIMVRIDTQDAAGFTLRLRGDAANEGGVLLAYDRADRSLSLDRTKGGAEIAAEFPSVERMPVTGGQVVELEIWVDRVSLEIFADAGTRVLTDLIAPQPGVVLALEGIDGEVRVERIAIAIAAAAAAGAELGAAGLA